MIRVILQGGLGNQMFEYAAAYALAHERNMPLALDMSFMDVFGHKPWCRAYELSVFALHNSALFTHKHRLAVRLLPRLRKWSRTCGKRHWGPFVFEMQHMNDAPQRESLVLFDYCANYHLFETYREDLLRAFTFAEQPNTANEQLLEAMQRTQSVAVHIRRGDYLSEAYKNIFYHPSEAWYRQAMHEMEKHVAQPQYFFFSDDIPWVREQFKDISNAVFVDINHGKDAYNDMRLMSHCKHNIIANSSFSWWGAWLNENHHKMVIAPAKYYMDEASNEKYKRNMLPQAWLQI